MSKERQWLSHLETSIPESARGYTVTMYSIALEGWRRGLTLKFYNENRRKSEVYYSLSYKNREHLFTSSMGDKVSHKARKICRNKHLTKEYLLEANVPAPPGELFKEEATDEEISRYGKELGFPLVVKPSDGTGGTGVIANINTLEELENALHYVRYDLKKPEIIVEKHYNGRGYRVFVIGNKVVAAFDRMPANVVGDGKNNIRKLLDSKIKERNKNPALFNRPIKIDKEMHYMLSQKQYSLNTVPQKDERVFLKTKNNVSSGGDSIDVTDQLSENIKSIAINAVKAIPDLGHAGLDLIVDEKNDTAVILEINSMPSIRNHLFPNEGVARDIPKEIIDFYFPETVDANRFPKPLYYFDYKSIYGLFQKGVAKEIKVPDVPKGNLTAKQFELYGNLKGVNYENWVRKQARTLKLNGYIKNLEKGTTSIVVSGNTDSVNEFNLLIKNKSPQTVEIFQVVEKKRINPVKIGFEVVNPSKKVKKRNGTSSKSPRNNTLEKSGYTPVHLKESNYRKSTNKKAKKAKSSKKKVNYKVEYEKLRNSTSWKITKPVRFIGSIIKK